MRAAREPERRGEHRVAAAPAHDVFEPRRSGSCAGSGRGPSGGLVLDSARPRRPSRSPTARAVVRSSGPGTTVGRRLRTGPQSSAPTERRYANGTSSTSRKTPIATRPKPPSSRNTVRERVEEDDLDVEDDEAHRDQIELHREALGRLVLGHDPALVRRLLRRVRPLRRQQLRRDERQQHEERRPGRSSRGSAGMAHPVHPLRRLRRPSGAGYPNRSRDSASGDGAPPTSELHELLGDVERPTRLDHRDTDVAEPGVGDVPVVAGRRRPSCRGPPTTSAPTPTFSPRRTHGAEIPTERSPWCDIAPAAAIDCAQRWALAVSSPSTA